MGNKYTNTQEFPKQVRLTEVKITFIDSVKPKTDPDPSNTKLKVALGQKSTLEGTWKRHLVVLVLYLR